MSFKERFAKNLGNQKSIARYRYEASKLMFILMSYLFFVFFFFTAGGYYDEIFGQLLTPSYILAIVSIGLFVYFYIICHFREKVKNITYIAGGGVGFFVFVCLLILFI